MAIDSITYPTIAKWYNSERREVVPYYTDTRGTKNEGHVSGTSFNQFTIDSSDATQANPKTLTLFTYANGVSVKMNYWRNGDNISGQIGLFNKDGNVINLNNVGRNLITWSTFTLYKSTKYNNTYDNYTFYYSPAAYDYGGSATQTHPRYYIYKGWLVNLKDNASPYAPPDIMGVNEVYDRANLGTYYNIAAIASTEYDSDLTALKNAINNGGDGTPITPILPSEDTSGTGGGDSGNPNYDPFSDPINSPNVPSVSSLDTGFISAYNPTKAQLQEVAGVMWTDNFIEELKKIWNSPIEGIVSLHMLPFTPPTYGYANCKIGNYNTGISMKAIFSQYIKLQGGSMHVDERWCSALDYSPYTRAFIHIPFVGIQPVNIDDVMNKTIALEYVVDVLTGSGVAFLKCEDAVLHTYPCNMAMKIPFTMSDHQLLYQSLSNFAVSTGKAVAAGGNSPSATAGAISSALNVVTSKHSTVQKSGVISSTYGMLDNFTAYIILHRPIQSLASNFGHFKGYPCNITYTLSSLSGYTEVEYAHLEGVTATDAEKEEIQSLLSQGVIL